MLKRLHHFGLIRLDRVHADIQRRGLIQRFGQFQRLLLAVHPNQRLKPFIRQIAAHSDRQLIHRRIHDLTQPYELLLGNRTLQALHIDDLVRAEQNESATKRTRARLRQMRENAAMPQNRVNSLRNDVTITRAQLFVLTQKARNLLVRCRFKLQHIEQQHLRAPQALRQAFARFARCGDFENAYTGVGFTTFAGAATIAGS